MRVMHLVPAIFGPDGIVGGAERYAYELARHMAREVPTCLLTFGGQTSAYTDGNLEVHVIGQPWQVRGQRTNPLALRMIRGLWGADIVHCHQRFVAATSLTALFCKLTRRRVFVTDLGGGGWDPAAYFNTDRWFDGHLHLSDYSRVGYGHAAKPWAHVISAGVDTDKFCPPPSLRPRCGALFVGRILPHKGIDVLIRALPGSMPLTIIGRELDHRYLADLKQMAAGKPVRFRHDCDDAALVAAYRVAACIVLPSVNCTLYQEKVRSAELLGQTLMEGMACGTPAICSALGGMPEVVEDGLSGFVVPPGDSAALSARLAWISQHPADAGRMGAVGRDRMLSKFTWSQVVRRCLEIYQR